MTLHRRQLLAGLGAGALALGSASGLATAAPLPPARRRSFLLVHGAWHNSFHWQAVVLRLTAAGHRVAALDLPGHGVHAKFPASYLAGDWAAFRTEPSPVRDITLDTMAEAVIAAARELGENGEKPIVVGHSVGGNAITRAAETAPDAFARLVYLTAFVPVRLPSPFAYEGLPEAKGANPGEARIGDPRTIGVARLNPRGDRDYLEVIRRGFYNDMAFDAFAPYALALTPDLPLSLYTGGGKVTRERWGRVPRTYIHCSLDRAIAPALQDLFVREADEFTPENRFVLHRMEVSHSPFASQPAKLAELLGAV